MAASVSPKSLVSVYQITRFTLDTHVTFFIQYQYVFAEIKSIHSFRDFMIITCRHTNCISYNHGLVTVITIRLRTLFFWVVVLRHWTIVARRFGTFYWPHLQQSRVQFLHWSCHTLRLGHCTLSRIWATNIHL